MHSSVLNKSVGSNSLQGSRDRDSSETTVSLFFKLMLFTLWMLSLGSAIGVVYVTFESRQHTQVLEELRREEIGLRVAAGQYELEKSSLGSYPRVESIATEELKMNLPPSGETVLVIRE